MIKLTDLLEDEKPHPIKSVPKRPKPPLPKKTKWWMPFVAGIGKLIHYKKWVNLFKSIEKHVEENPDAIKDADDFMNATKNFIESAEEFKKKYPHAKKTNLFLDKIIKDNG